MSEPSTSRTLPNIDAALAAAVYFIATLLVITPTTDSIMSMLPMHIGDERWRFMTLGVFSNALLVPPLGLFLAVITAQSAGMRGAQRFIGAICAAFAVIAAVFTAVFIASYVQAGALVAPSLQRAAGVASAGATAKYLCALIAFALLSRAALTRQRSSVERTLTRA